MVSTSCGAATACYTLPILACWFCSVQSLLDLKLPFLQTQRCPAGTDLEQPASAESIQLQFTAKSGQWPVMSTDFARPSLGLFAWCCFPLLGYALIRGLSDCEQFGGFCWQVEAQSISSHLRNLLHLLAVSIILAWLCNVPPSGPGTSRYRAILAAVALCDFVLTKFFWENCEDFMAHSLSAGSTFGFFDLFLASATLLTLVIHTCEGLPVLRRCFQQLSHSMGAAAGQQNPELYLSASGQRNYLIYLALLIAFHVALVLVFPDEIHAHHYWVGFVVASCCIFPSPLSRLLLLKSVTWRIGRCSFAPWWLRSCKTSTTMSGICSGLPGFWNLFKLLIQV